MDAFLHRIPTEPADIAATGIDGTDLMGLLMKLIYMDRLETVRQFADAIKLPYHIVLDLVQMAVDRKLLINAGLAQRAGNLADMSYTFTEEGRRWTIDALNRVGYTGPAPVTLEEFTDQVNLQKLTNEVVTFERIRKAIGCAHLRRRADRAVRAGAELRPRHAALRAAGQRQNLSGAVPGQRLQRRDLRALRHHRRGPDHPRLRPQHSHSARTAPK